MHRSKFAASTSTSSRRSTAPRRDNTDRRAPARDELPAGLIIPQNRTVDHLRWQDLC